MTTYALQTPGPHGSRRIELHSTRTGQPLDLGTVPPKVAVLDHLAAAGWEPTGPTIERDDGSYWTEVRECEPVPLPVTEHVALSANVNDTAETLADPALIDLNTTPILILADELYQFAKDAHDVLTMNGADQHADPESTTQLLVSLARARGYVPDPRTLTPRSQETTT